MLKLLNLNNGDMVAMTLSVEQGSLVPMALDWHYEISTDERVQHVRGSGFSLFPYRPTSAV
jgi:hypothetical protein